MAYDLLAAYQRQLSTPTDVPKRWTKQRSGRSGRRRHQGQRWLDSVGGTSNTMTAIYDGRDDSRNDFSEMCHVVTREVPGVPDPRSANLNYTVPEGQWLGRAPAV